MSRSKTLRELGEDVAIAALVRTLGVTADGVTGPGDDCAVVPVESASDDWLLTSDPVVEGIHFARRAEPRAIGHKAAGRVLSDIAAMGGKPMWLLINVTAPPSCSVDRLKAIYRGAAALCRKYGAQIVGGDVGTGDVLALHVFGVGRVPRGAAVRRVGARPGDGLYVTGSLGGSLRGKHLKFEPRITEGLWLREQGWPSAMMDVSDGLATDLRRLLKLNRVGAELVADRIPVSEVARAMRDGRTPLERALSDGEDYELLFTVPEGRQAAFESSWREAHRLSCTRIGHIVPGRERVVLVERDGTRRTWQGRGFEHFKS